MRSSAVPPRNCATWRPQAGTCCSAPVVPTSCRRRSRRATSAIPAADAPPGTASIASTPSSAPATTAWRSTRPTWRWPWPSSMPVVHVRATRAAHHSDRRFLLAARRHPGGGQHTAPGELILGIELPPSAFADHSWYLKVRDRHSYAFALVSVAAGLTITDGVIRSAALALGAVAATPWRLRAARGEPRRTSTRRRMRSTRPPHWRWNGAQPLPQNAFKVDLGRHSVVRALTLAAQVRTS